MVYQPEKTHQPERKYISLIRFYYRNSVSGFGLVENSIVVGAKKGTQTNFQLYCQHNHVYGRLWDEKGVNSDREYYI
jgi:hypothetical protein